MKTDKRFPLCWPNSWPRTLKIKVKVSAFRVSQNKAQNNLLRELKLLSAKEIIISTNIKLRNDGLPYASQREPDDKGVAIYFKYNDKPMVFACDKYNLIGDNLHAVGKTIEALRGIERWGASDMLERAFTGFESLPGPDQQVVIHWREILDYYGDDIQEANEAYKRKRNNAHPDKGGTNEEFYKLNQAWADCEKELN